MTDNNLPWKYSHLKYWIGYRKWEAIKSLKDNNQRRNLLDAHKCGKKVLFIHIPKTAGVSLIRTYEDYFSDARHSPALLYKLLLGTKFSEFATFAIVRNPWARLFSAYNFLIGGGLIETDREMGQILIRECPSFEQFVKEWLPKYGVCSYMHFVPQHEFVCGWGDSVIVKNIIKLEQLDAGWPDLTAKLGISQREIPRANAGTKRDYREYYDKKSTDIVGKLYKKDINLLGYSYD